MRRLANFIGGESVTPKSGKYVELISPVTGQPFAEMPHGGFKKSGYGKDLSVYGFEDYTRVKHVMSNISS